MRRALIGLVGFGTMACYTSVPLVSAPRQGQEMVVELTDAGAVSLAQYLGPGVATLVGRFASESPDSLRLSVTSSETRAGDLHLWQGESVAVQKSLIARTSERKISVLKSAGVIGAVIALAMTISGGFNNSTTGGGKTPPPSGQ